MIKLLIMKNKNLLKLNIVVALIILATYYTTFAAEIIYGPGTSSAEITPIGTKTDTDSAISPPTSYIDNNTASLISQIVPMQPSSNATPVDSPSISPATVAVSESPLSGTTVLSGLGFTTKTITSSKAPTTQAPTYALINATTRHIYSTKDLNGKYPVSGLTNLMTAYLATQYLKMDSVLEVRQTAVRGIDKDAAIAALNTGDTITLKDAIASMFVKGCVDSSNVVAENVSGSLEEFVTLMNQTAATLGMTNTHFVDPSGISNNNESTAYDISLLLAKVCENAELVKLLTLSEYTLPAVKKRDKLVLYSRNTQLSDKSSNYNADVTASRMGYAAKAKFCVASMMNYNNNYVIAVVLKAEGSQFSDTKKLFEFGKIATTEDISSN